MKKVFMYTLAFLAMFMSIGLTTANKAYAANLIGELKLDIPNYIGGAYWSNRTSPKGTFTVTGASSDIAYCAVVVNKTDISGKTYNYNTYFSPISTADADVLNCSVSISPLEANYTYLQGKYTMFPGVANKEKEVLDSVSTASFKSYKIDNIAPETKVSSVKLSSGKTLDITAKIDNQDSPFSANAEYMYRLNNGSWKNFTTGTTTAKFTMSDYGKYDFCTIGFDDLGNKEVKTCTAEGTYTLEEPEPTPEPVITPTPTPTPAPAPVTTPTTPSAPNTGTVLAVNDEVDEEVVDETETEETVDLDWDTVENEEEVDETDETETVKKSKLGWIIGILVLLLTAGLVIFFILKRRKEEEEEQK